MKQERTVKVTLEFYADDLQAILNAANFGEDGAIQLEGMTDERFDEFEAEIVDSAQVFKEEIVEGSEDACANDWLHSWGGEDEL